MRVEAQKPGQEVMGVQFRNPARDPLVPMEGK
ncbi:hypothetical protein PVAP13_2KG023616 [Panicum virgatum]|uniref:Uncharacterized protein n=1 Tax=Panicum virgatum TaxID=38727 RepID=A0A8T0W4L7_PANVG|nr:hypothetical protein PVAP13_2KG023616 [Panicum virgatum]